MPRAVHAREFVADGITPIAAYSCASRVRPGPSFLFESAPGPSQTSRYSIIGLGTLGELIASDGAVSVREGGHSEAFAGPDVFEGARSLMRRMAPEPSGGLGVGRFLGAYGAAAFEFAGYVERLPRLRRNEDPMPDLHLVVPETVVVFDHFTHRMTLLTLADAAGSVRDDGDLVEALNAASIAPLATVDLGPGVAGRSSADVSPAPMSIPFITAVERAKESIVAGDAFQIVLSQRWNVDGCARPFDAYRALRTINPSPYMFYLDLGWGALFGSSPEVLARLDGSRAMVRPLAGTRSRNPNPDEERRIAAQLKHDVKERAEHIMLVDLGRNDLGKTSVPGSVRVTDLLSVEYYSHVMHLVSEVRGVLQPGRDAFDLFAAVFPAGTVSGAPKIRAMELIAELEGVRRGFYAGSIGYFGFDGSMDTCITLRSAHHYGGSYHVQAGAGIVADSVPESEDRECRAKAGAVFAALAAVSGGAAA
jgi:anthranilate synthase component 1